MLDDGEIGTLADALRAMYPEEVSRIRDGAKGKYDRFRRDPVGYIERVLRKKITAQQKDVCNALMEWPHRVIVKSANIQGKCLASSDLVTMADGGMARAGELVGKEFLMPTLVGGRVVARRAKAELNLFEEVCEITTETGLRIVRNLNHPVWGAVGRFKGGATPKIGGGGWRTHGELSAEWDGHRWVVAVADSFDVAGEDQLTDDEVKVAAYLTGDGGLTAKTPVFTQTPGDQLDEFVGCVTRMGCEARQIPSDPISYRICGPTKAPGGNPVTNLMRRLGLMGKGSRHKFVPNEILSASLRQQAMYLSRLYATDGWACVNGRNKTEFQIGYCSASETLARQVQLMLVRFGIHAKLRFREAVAAWAVEIAGAADAVAFEKKIGIHGKEWQAMRVRQRASQVVMDKHGWRRDGCPPGTRWERVRSVRVLEPQWTVAIEVEEEHTFLSPVYEHNTFLGAALTNWYYDCYNPGVCITTAPTARDVTDLLWKEVRQLRKTRWDFKGDVMPMLTDGPNHYAKGYTGTTAEAFHGRHDDHLFFIIDEATGVGEHVFRGIKSMFKPNGKHFWLMLLNPIDTTTPVYAEEQSGQYKVIRLSALEHPNIVAELKGEEPPIPAAVDMSVLNQWFIDWFEEVHPDDKRPGDIVWPPDWSLKHGALQRIGKGRQRVLRPDVNGQARVLGLWPSASEWSVWNEKAWQAACRTLPDQKPLPLDWLSLPQIGCDVSRGGGDKTEVIVQCDLIALEHRVGSAWDVSRTAAVLKEYAAKWVAEYNRNRRLGTPLADAREVPIKVDDDGVGGGVVDVLRADGYNAIGVGAGTVAQKPDKYPLMRDQLWFEIVMAANKDMIDVSRLPEKSLVELKRQAMAVRFENDFRGRRYVWHKDKTRKAIGRSPDGMDALNLAFFTGHGSGDAPFVMRRGGNG